MSQVTPIATNYVDGKDFAVIENSPSGAVSNTSIFVLDSPGCLDSNFASFPAGQVAMVLTSNICDFSTVALNAQQNGAISLLIRNSIEESDPFQAELNDNNIIIPILGITYLLGDDLASALNPTVDILVEGGEEISYTSNLFADTVGTNENSIIVIGSHLDSVPAGPGINDNGSGSSVNLELAIQLYKFDLGLPNTIRFAWWGAEELGLLGSEYYVNNLTPTGKFNERNTIYDTNYIILLA